jgi:hypothetical protein
MTTETDQSEMVTGALHHVTPWFLGAELNRVPGGWTALIRIDPNMAGARADQQGLPDKSLLAAAKNPRVSRLWADSVARVNASLPPEWKILAFTPVLECQPAGPLAVADDASSPCSY